MKPAKAILPPQDIDAPDLICLSINSEWRDILATAVQRLEYPVSWEEGTDITRAEQNIFRFYRMLRNAEMNCCDDVCLDYIPSESFIEYFPQNPFTQPDLIPTFYDHPPFYVESGVVFTDIFRMPTNPFSWNDISATGLPRIRVNVTGAVKVGLGLVSIVNGGIIFVTKDDDITTSKWYELTSIGMTDVTSIVAAIPAIITALIGGNPLPEEIYQDETIDVIFNTPGAHHIDITFVPRVSPDTIIGFGGGLRKVEICGSQRDIMEFRQNPTNACLLEYRSKSSDPWVTMFDYGQCSTNNCCDQTPPLFRYDGDGNLEQSTDGGATYTPAQQYDTRYNSPQFPPLPGGDGLDKKCGAATGAALLFKQQIKNQLTAEMSRADLLNLISTWVKTFIATSNPLNALLTVLANLSFGLSMAALLAGLTDADFDDTLKCILYCNMGNDATFTTAQWGQVKADITAKLPYPTNSFFNNLMNALGPAGLTNVVRAGAVGSGDCSGCTDCPPECDLANWSIFVGAANSNAYGTEVSRTSNSITIDSVFDPYVTGTWFIVVTTNDANKCCTVSITDTDGNPFNASFAIACGNSVPADLVSWPSAGGASIVTDKNTVAIGTGGAKRLVLTFS